MIVGAADNEGMPIPFVVSTLLTTAPFETPGLHFIDVGQGSALLIRGEAGEVALIDSGPAAGAEAILAALVAHEVDEVGLWVHTHYDADHLGGFARVAAGLDGLWPSQDDLQIDRLWDRGIAAPVPETDAASLYFGLVGDRRERPEPGFVHTAPGLRIEVLELDPVPADAPENARGLALCVEVGGLRALLPGDLPADRVELAAAACGPVDVLWSSHHGSADASSAAAIELADPLFTVISAGHDNGYCHPSPVALAQLRDRSAWLLDAAGLDPRGACPPLADVLGPAHVLIGGDLWIDASLRAWIGSPTTGWVGELPS
jgi:beta-lactamase superfamily II metal-dependent hydrolase